MVVEGNISTKGLRDILSRFNNTINSNYISDVVKVYYRGSYEREKNTQNRCANLLNDTDIPVKLCLEKRLQNVFKW